MDAKSIRVYSSVYSGIQVLEAIVRGIAVMKRKSDAYVNATQILKVAGVEKGKRTKILEKDITNGEHEKIQGGYGKYQGTWIPLERGRELAHQYGVGHLLAPIFDAAPATSSESFPGSQRFPAVSLSKQPARSSQTAAFPPASVVSPVPDYGIQGSTPSSLELLQKGRLPGAAISPAGLNGVFSGDSDLLFGYQSSDRAPSLKRGRETESLDNIPTHFMAYQPDVEAHAQVSNGDGPPPPKKPRTDNVNAGVLNGATALPSAMMMDYSLRPALFEDLDFSLSKAGSRAQQALVAIDNDDCPRLLSALTILQADNGPHLDGALKLDDEGHTALHWAAALARQGIVEALVRSGTDVTSRNAIGETALMRAVKSSYNYEQQTFGALLSSLEGSLMLVDDSNRTLLHHIVQLAAVKGRATAARYYLQVVFEWIARQLRGNYRDFVDVQDINGDTALNVAARIGSRALVRMLLDVGANRTIPNKLGLRAGDFGVEEDTLQPNPVEDALSSLRANKSAPLQRSSNIISGITAKMEALASEFASELDAKQSAITMNQVHLRVATRQLAEQRRQIQTWKSRCQELDQGKQRVKNVQRALAQEEGFEWTGRTEADGGAARESAGLPFSYRGAARPTPSTVGAVEISFELGTDPPIPSGDSTATLVKLRRIKTWSARVEQILSERIRRLQGAGAYKEVQCKRIVSLCTKVPVEEVERMLESLLNAVESDSDNLDMERVSGFLAKVRNGNI
ncbi:apses-domain-containing protein [Dacryopinax primogenitus]|uniref:Apses-domain-containing protein n=1 Tax=Dacryopinax primogenitus (strain DJM 731) TaxID=1858805 RepID=M5GCD0_DACPD|nr:apses-domain-containing protein [Dacryopinax primogenitus]EJU03812.1 apses-domain-containing protein [Dacryopinax primogenitus]